MKPRRLTLLAFCATAALVLLTIIVLTLVIIAAYSQLAGAQEESPSERMRVEMFGWRLEDHTLVWSVSTGGLNVQDEFEPVGKPKTLAWIIGSDTIIYDETEHEITAEWQEHLDTTFHHFLYDLYQTTIPTVDEPDKEAEPVGARAKL